MAPERGAQRTDMDWTWRTTSEALLARAQAGDENAYIELLRQASPVANRAVRRILHTEADAEDAIQEAAMRSFFKLSTFDGRAQFSTWFTRIAINSALMILRKHRRGCDLALTVDQEATDSMVMNIADPNPNPLDVLRTKQEYEVLRHAISSLPLNLKESLLAQCNLDLTVAEIASILNLTVPATKTRLLRARRHVIAKAGARLLPNSRADDMSNTQALSPL